MDMTVKVFCKTHGACDEGREWAVVNCKTMLDVWDKARPGWLVWVATRPGVLPAAEQRKFACWYVRQVWHLLTDERSRHAVEVAERYADGNATDDDLAAAWTAAWAAAGDAAWAAARNAAWAAAWTAAWAAAGDAARDAAWAAAWTAAWAAAGDAARDAAWAAQAEYLRKNCSPNFSKAGGEGK